jgi:hypothetical protein
MSCHTFTHFLSSLSFANELNTEFSELLTAASNKPRVGQRSGYSSSLRARRSGDRIAVGVKFLHPSRRPLGPAPSPILRVLGLFGSRPFSYTTGTRSIWVPPFLLHDGYQVYLSPAPSIRWVPGLFGSRLFYTMGTRSIWVPPLLLYDGTRYIWVPPLLL